MLPRGVGELEAKRRCGWQMDDMRLPSAGLNFMSSFANKTLLFAQTLGAEQPNTACCGYPSVPRIQLGR